MFLFVRVKKMLTKLDVSKYLYIIGIAIMCKYTILNSERSEERWFCTITLLFLIFFYNQYFVIEPLWSLRAAYDTLVVVGT